MPTVSELMAGAISSSQTGLKVWGGIIINVKDSPFNAKGDGITDDTEAIQKAINYANNIGKKEITFPAGTYKYGVLTNISGIIFVGDGVTLNGITKVDFTSTAALWGDVQQRAVNVKYPPSSLVAATGDGVTDDSAAIKAILAHLTTNGGGTIFFPKGTYILRGIVVPSNIKFVGSNATIQAMDVYYTTTTQAVSADGTSVTVADASGISIGDVAIVKSTDIDFVVVTGKVGKTLTIAPFRIFRGSTETHIGFKYAHTTGADFIIPSQVFWITQGLTIASDSLDGVVKVGGVKNVSFEGLKFIGSRDSNNYSKYSVYDLVSNGILFFYRTEKCRVIDCTFDQIYSTTTLFYGWNTIFEFKSNVVTDVGYVIPTSVSPQERDSTSGITLHWDQRFSTDTATAAFHVSDSYFVENNKFINCWNGGVFASGSNNGVISHNDVDGFVSHGLAVYGGDLGIGTSSVKVSENTVRNGLVGLDTLAYGIGIWLSVVSNSVTAFGNTINNCERGLVTSIISNTIISTNTISNCIKTYLELNYRSVNVNVCDNLFYQGIDFSGSIADACAILLDSSDSTSENINIVLKDNTYSFPSTFNGSKVVSVVKSNDTAFINEKGSALIGFADITDAVSTVKLKFINCDFTGFSSSGLTSGNSTRINCQETSGAIETVATVPIRYNFKEYAVIDSGSSAARPTGITTGYQYFDTTLGKPIWWNGTAWVDSAGTVV